jgi:hypothetical protein
MAAELFDIEVHWMVDKRMFELLLHAATSIWTSFLLSLKAGHL